MASGRNAALSRRGLVFSLCLVAGDVRRVEPVAEIDPGHGGAGESQGVYKPAQRGAPSGLRVQRIVSTIKRDWLPPLVGRDQSRWSERFNLDHPEDSLVHVQSPWGRIVPEERLTPAPSLTSPGLQAPARVARSTA